MSYRILSLMNASNSVVPLYTNTPTSASEHGTMFGQPQKRNISELMRGIEGNSSSQMTHNRSSTSSHLHSLASPGPLTDPVIPDERYETVLQNSCICRRCRQQSAPSEHSEYGIVESVDVDSGYGIEPSYEIKLASIHSGICDSSYEQQRIHDMMTLRMRLAKSHGYDTAFLRPHTFVAPYLNVFSKGLTHDQNGFVNSEEMVKLLMALEQRDSSKLAQLKLGGTLKLVDPSAAWSNDIVGACPNTYRYSRQPSLYSNYIAAEMTELYCMSLARDIPFSQYLTSSIISDCCGYLNALKEYHPVEGKVTSDNIFRGPMYGDLQGPYISQFLYRDLRMGGFMQKQKYPTDLEGYDFMKSWDTAISAQSGIIKESPPPIRSTARYLITGRDLACYVHSDEPYQACYHACCLLLDLKVPLNPGIVKLMKANPTEAFFVNLGRADMQSILNLVGRNALLSSWYAKWNTLFPRPEAIAIEVERVFRDNRNTYCISPELLRNAVLEGVRSRNGNVLLSQCYPEGAPLHPATPSGHAAIAGACVTALKFFFDTNYELDVYEPDANGEILINTGKKTTVGDELNKLGSNMGIGRNWAGIHYHMDAIAGLKLGEKVTISCLQDLIQRYPYDLSVTFPRFNGHTTTIKK